MELQNGKMDVEMKILISIVIVLFFVGFVSATNYYVDATNGNDANNGLSDATAWKTIAKVNDFAETTRFSDGDTINFKRGEVWKNDEAVGFDSASINWGTINELTIQDYGIGPKPWIDGTTQAAIYIEGYDKLSNLVIRNLDVSGMGWIGLPAVSNIYVVRVTDITIDGIYMDGHKGTPDEFTVKGPIKIGPNLGDLVIKNCEIFNIMQRNTLYRGDVSSYTIVINNYHIAENAKITGSVKIINNTVHDVAGDILQPANVRPPGGFLIANNLFYHFGENAIDFKSCSNVIVENNEIYRDFGASDKYCEETWPDKVFNMGMIVTHAVTDGPTCENIIIRNNYIHSSGNFRTFEIGGANNLKIYNNYFKDIGRMELSCNGCSVYNNVWDITHDPVCDDFIYCTLGTTSCSAATLSLISIGQYAKSCKIFNNTFYAKSNTINYGMYYRKYSTSVDNEIFNNIFYFDRDDTNTYPFYFYIRDGSTDIPSVYNNLYFNPSSTNRLYWEGTIYTSSQQTDWQSAGHPGDIFTDPLFVDAVNGDFHLQPTSPACTASETGSYIGAYSCLSTSTCQSLGYSCCNSCESNPQSLYDGDCPGVCCGVCATPSACGDADSDFSGVVSITELINYITAWKAGNVNINDLINGITEWKNGCS